MRRIILLILILVFSISVFGDTLLRLKSYRESGDIYLNGKKAGKLGGGIRGIRLKPGEHVLEIKDHQEDGSFYYFKRIVEGFEIDGTQDLEVIMEKRYSEEYYLKKIDEEPENIILMEQYMEIYPEGKMTIKVAKKYKELMKDVPQGFVLVLGGSFVMGDTMNEIPGESYKDERPAHKVTFTYNYILSKYEVTQKEYEAIMGNNPSFFKGESRPVEQVRWWDAIKYCNLLSKKMGLSPAYDEKSGRLLDEYGVMTNDITKVKGFRLPTEAEWEYAARERGRNVRFGNGKNVAKSSEINFDSVSGSYSYKETGEYRRETVDVGSFAPNAIGLYDMSGNVWEWCTDWYFEYYGYDQTNPVVLNDEIYKVVRGGSWFVLAHDIRVSNRLNFNPNSSFDFLGFRIARTQ